MPQHVLLQQHSLTQHRILLHARHESTIDYKTVHTYYTTATSLTARAPCALAILTQHAVNPVVFVQNIISAPVEYEQRPLCHSRQQPGEGWRNSRGCDFLKILIFFLAKKITVEQ
jgi:hypothetical protein